MYLSFLFKVTGSLLFASSFTLAFALAVVLVFLDGKDPTCTSSWKSSGKCSQMLITANIISYKLHV